MCLQEDLKKETLLKQFKIVKSHTNTSHVQQFGNKVKKPKLLESLCVLLNSLFAALLSAPSL